MLDPMYAHPQIPFRNSRNLSNFRIRDLFQHHGDNDALIFLQLSDSSVQCRNLLAFFTYFFRMIFYDVIVELLGRLSFSRTEVRKTGIDPDSIDPSRQLGLVPEFIQVLPNLDKRLLHQIIRYIRIARIAIAEVEDPFRVFLKQLFKCNTLWIFHRARSLDGEVGLNVTIAWISGTKLA